MSDYTIAWIVVGATGLGACLALFLALRRWTAARILAPLVAATWFFIPWRFQEAPEHYAPAFVVLLFRGLFEPDGEPGVVGRTLALATAAAVAVFLIGVGTRMLARMAGRWRRRRGRAP